MKMKEDLQVRQIIENEWVTMFQENREEIRREAKEQISKIQVENKKTYNKKRKEARKYMYDELVAIHGPYRITRIMRHDRYGVEKVGEHEDPNHTTSSADHMKPWIDDFSEESSDSDNDSNI